jgi:hypothetical protein
MGIKDKANSTERVEKYEFVYREREMTNFKSLVATYRVVEGQRILILTVGRVTGDSQIKYFQK